MCLTNYLLCPCEFHPAGGSWLDVHPDQAYGPPFLSLVLQPNNTWVLKGGLGGLCVAWANDLVYSICGCFFPWNLLGLVGFASGPPPFL